MFDIGWSEMAIIMLLALIIIGPKDLPRVARTIGQWVRKGRMMAREFQTSLEDMARDTELDDVRKEIENVGRTDLKKAVENTIDPKGELSKAFDTSTEMTGTPALPDKSAKDGETQAAASANGRAGGGSATNNGAAATAVGRKTAASSKTATPSKAAAKSRTSRSATTKPAAGKAAPATAKTARKTAARKTSPAAGKPASKPAAAKKPVSSAKRSAKPAAAAKLGTDPSPADESSGGDRTAMAAKPS